MTRSMVDSTNIYDDPLTAQLVAYYCDGAYAVSAATVRARFRTATLVSISAVGTNSGIVGDVEPGCMTIAQAIQWVQMRRRMGIDPTCYVNEMNTWQSARMSFNAAGVPQPHWWVADYDRIALLPLGAVAKQFENPLYTHGHFDLSIVADYWPGVDPIASAPQPSKGGFLMSLSDADQQQLYRLVQDNHTAISRLELALGTAIRRPDGTYAIVDVPNLPNFAGWSRMVTADLEAIKNK